MAKFLHEFWEMQCHALFCSDFAVDIQKSLKFAVPSPDEIKHIEPVYFYMSSLGFSKLGERTADPAISWLMKMTLDRPQLISLAAGFTDDTSLPVEETRELIENILAVPRKGQAALQYGSTVGDPALRAQVAAMLLRQDTDSKPGVQYSQDQVLITHGSQQLLYLLTEAICDPGDIVLVEDPTYFVYLGILQSHGLRCRGIAVQRDGISIERLEEVLESLKKSGDLPRVKMLYLVTYFQNPSGITTSLEKKAAALKLLKRYEKAAGHPIYVLEDAAYRDLRFTGEDVPSAMTLDFTNDRVLYAGTFSKPFATGIRVGFGYLPKPVFEVVVRIKGNHDFGTANLLQQILLRALVSKAYDKHLKALQLRYKQKAAVMVQALREFFPQTIQWREPEGGLYVWAGIPSKKATGPKSRIFQSALNHDVLYVPGELCYAEDKTRNKPRNEMRLSFGGASEKNIIQGIARLGAVLNELK